MDIVSAKILLRKAYATSTGLFDYIKHEMFERTITDADLKRPLIEAARHKSVDLDLVGGIPNAMRIYAKARVWEHFHMTLFEFLELPHAYFDHVLRICNEENAEKNKKDREEINQFKAGLNQQN